MGYCDTIDTTNISASQWETIYNTGGYYGEGSGKGSKLENNCVLIAWLTKFISTNNIKSILDIGCGDMQWMPIVLQTLQNIEYTGADCSSKILSQNKKKYPDIEFVKIDITKDISFIEKKYDLVFCKDILQHNISNHNEVIKNIFSFYTKIILITPHYVKLPLNYNFMWLRDYESEEIKSIYYYENEEIKGIYFNNS